MEAELLHADGPSDMMKLVVAFRNFANAPPTAVKLSDKTITVSEMLIAVTANGTAVTPRQALHYLKFVMYQERHRSK